MYTKTIHLKPDHVRALQKASFEARMSSSNLQFMIDQHLADEDDSFLGSDLYFGLLEDYMLKYLQLQDLLIGIIDLVTGEHRTDLTFHYDNNYKILQLQSDEAEVNVSQDYENYQPVTDRRFLSFVDFIAQCYPLPENAVAVQTGPERVLTRTVTFQVTDKCNLACTYCYQINKGTRKMKFDDAKLFIDKLLSGEDGFKEYISLENSPGIVLEFIGGEPFLEIDLIDQIVDYFRLQVIKKNHPWKDKFCISICSNGVLYTDPEVQRFLQKNKDCISFSVTLDGNKELHDACRVFPDGSGSFDIAEAAAQDWMNRGYYMGSKITISPDNMPYIYEALMHIISLGYDEINANCIFEQEWTEEQGNDLYKLLKRFSNFLLADSKYKDLDCSLLMSNIGHPKQTDDIQNWCGGTGSMLAMDPDGYLFPCIRYMESSLGSSRPPLSIGSIHTGLATCESDKKCVECLNAITRRSQSVDDCFYCSIADGCAWCSAWNYQKFGTPDHRDTGICNVHKGRVLANVYYWNNYYKKYDIPKVFDMWLPKEQAVAIIGEEEYTELVKLVKSLGGYVNESETRIYNYKEDSNN